jgi:gamma-glutamylcyclotransferase (GGCT)/AIG2-like uncharacterized protein YtfP
MAAMVDPPDALFTYGTLMPGHLRWPMLSSAADAWERASAPGVLYDTGSGWPAASFGLRSGGAGVGPASTVPGWVVRFAPGVLDALLPGLDAMEGIGAGGPDPYVRRVVVTSAGEAWAYDATEVGASWVAIEAWEGRPEA